LLSTASTSALPNSFIPFFMLIWVMTVCSSVAWMWP
jgi:hypothetical protein